MGSSIEKLASAIINRLIDLLIWLSKRAFRLLTRGSAQGALHVLPAPAHKGAAVGYGAVTAVVPTLVGALIGLSGGGDGVVVGALIGVTIGGVAGWVVSKESLTRLAVTRGTAIRLGTQRGAFNVPQTVAIKRVDRLRHVAVFGATGSGKSVALQNLVLQDAAAPRKPGIMVVDIKDDLALKLATRIPPARLTDILLFDPADTDFPPAFNPLAHVPPAERTLAASELVTCFYRLFADSWGPRLEHVLRSSLYTLLHVPDATLLDLTRILTDDQYRAWCLGFITHDQLVLDFWLKQFPSIVGKSGSTANVGSILNKLGVFMYPEIRNVIGQTRRGLDLRTAMDAGHIVLCNLPQGVLGEDAANFLAAMLVGKAQQAGQSRVNLPEDQRRPFYLLADEFQDYETGAFKKILIQGRGMGLGLVAATQYHDQLAGDTYQALVHNSAYGLFCRQVQGRHTMQAQKWQEMDTPDAVTLLTAAPPPTASQQQQFAQVRAQSRRALCQPRAHVEADIRRRMSSVPQPATPTVHRTVPTAPAVTPRPTVPPATAPRTAPAPATTPRSTLPPTQRTVPVTPPTAQTAAPAPAPVPTTPPAPIPPPPPRRTKRTTKLD